MSTKCQNSCFWADQANQGKIRTNFSKKINLWNRPGGTDLQIAKKIRKAKTDSFTGFDLTIQDDEGRPIERPEIKNLIGIRASLEGTTPEAVVADLHNRGLSTKDMKSELADLLIDRIEPIAKEIDHLRNSADGNAYVDELLLEGQQKAEEIAENTMKDVRKLVGICNQ